MLKDIKLWLSISMKRNVPHSLLLLIRILDFEQNKFSIDLDETQDEILRRSKSDAYYIESMRSFEKAFGIDRLEEIIDKVKTKREVSLFFFLNQKHIWRAFIHLPLC